MCLAVPGKILNVFDSNGMQMGDVDFAGSQQTICLAYVENAEPGKFVLVHAGFAISVLDEDEAQCSLDLWDEMIQKSSENEDYQIKWGKSEP